MGAWLLGLCLFSGSATAVGQTLDARTLFERGEDAYAEGRYEDAITSWQQGYALDPRPGFIFNMAQAYARLGRVTDEIAALERYVAETPATDPTIPPAQARLSVLRERLARTSIRLRGDLRGGTVRIDGSPRADARVDQPIALPPGSHRIEVLAPGYQTATAAVAVSAGEMVDVPIELVRVETHRSPVPVALMIGGGVALATGAAIGGVAFSHARDAYEGTDAADQAHRLAIGADVAMGVGAAAAVTGLVLLLVQRDDDDPTAFRLSPAVARSGALLVFSGEL